MAPTFVQRVKASTETSPAFRRVMYRNRETVWSCPVDRMTGVRKPPMMPRTAMTWKRSRTARTNAAAVVAASKRAETAVLKKGSA